MPTNTQTKGKRGGKTSTTWQKGCPPPNPAGRPKDGQSWRDVIAELSNANVEDIIQMVGEHNDLGRAQLRAHTEKCESCNKVMKK